MNMEKRYLTLEGFWLSSMITHSPWLKMWDEIKLKLSGTSDSSMEGSEGPEWGHQTV